MDRTSWIILIACALGFFGWKTWYEKTYGPYLAEQRVLAQQAARARAAGNATATPVSATPGATPRSTVAAATPGNQTTSGAAPAVEPTSANVAESFEKFTTKFLEVEFTNLGGGIAEIGLLKHKLDVNGPVRLNRDRPSPIGAVSFLVGEEDRSAYSAVREADGMSYERVLPDGLQIRKRFTVTGEKLGEYQMQMEITLRNVGIQPVERQGYFVGLGSAAPVHPRDLVTYTGLNYKGQKGKGTFIDANWFQAKSFFGFIPTRAAQDIYAAQVPGLQWAGVKNQYFTTLTTVVEGKADRVWGRPFQIELPGAERPLPGIEAALGMEGFRIEPGKELVQKFSLYTGPKEHRRLAALGAGQDEVMNYGMFKPVSLALLWAMNTLKGILGNYALAILVLTLVIKTSLWPLQNAATSSMRKMSALAPKVNELKEKYKDDPTKMNQEMMQLYKDYGINPFGGCLPMMVQIPIFFGFYAMLGSAVELRNSPFLWVNDLSQPDTVFHLGPLPVNILPLVMAATMLWQMQLTPKTGDQVQQRVFMFMPLIFVSFCYNYASALALYWTAQNLFSIVQLYLTRNRPIPALTKFPRGPQSGPRPGAGGTGRKKR